MFAHSKKVIIGIAAVGALMMPLTACGSDGSSSNDGIGNDPNTAALIRQDIKDGKSMCGGEKSGAVADIQSGKLKPTRVDEAISYDEAVKHADVHVHACAEWAVNSEPADDGVTVSDVEQSIRVSRGFERVCSEHDTDIASQLIGWGTYAGWPQYKAVRCDDGTTVAVRDW